LADKKGLDDSWAREVYAAAKGIDLDMAVT